MKIRRFLVAILAAFFGLSLTLTTAQPRAAASAAQPVPVNAVDAQQTNTCQTILTRAMEALNNNCSNLDRNKACYGNNAVDAELQNPTVKFNTLGDKAPIQAIRRIVTSPLDLQQGTWGLSLLKLQANLPDTMPGQNVLFLIFGNITLDNTSGNMQAFYFTSGLGAPACKEAPRDGILVRSPNHTEVTFTANGVQVTIASTVILRAERNKSLDISLVEGHARVTTPQGSTTLQPGQTASIPMGGSSGLEPVSKPSVPAATASDPALPAVITATEKFSPPHAPINVSIEGCITKINGNKATINGQDVQFASNDPVMSKAKPGDCVQIEGSIETPADSASASPDKGAVIAKTSKPNHPTNPSGSNAGGNNAANGNGGGNGQGNNGNGNGGGNGSNSGGNGQGNNGNGNGNGGGNGSNGGGNGQGNNGNGNGGGDGSNGGGNGQGNNGNGNGNGGNGNGGGGGGGNGQGNNGNGNGNGGGNGSNGGGNGQGNNGNGNGNGGGKKN
ncbi:MAG: hypothetical protein IT324_11000 [Anaerolineae bacterium]|nr:hypothetical protein [Anaerolineae bacterium]